MRPSSQLTSDKLRGGYYTPDFLVDACIFRAMDLVGRNQRRIKILEPAAGDGAFVRGIARTSWAGSVDMFCIEKSPVEAQKCFQTLQGTGVAGRATASSFFDWAESDSPQFDAILGNPPFVRYQFVPLEDRIAAERLLADRGTLDGVSNLFIPFVLVSLRLIRPGGAFAMVLPSEFLCTVSGDQVRSALIAELDAVQVDLFPRESFPDILQDVTVVSGRKRANRTAEGTVRFVEHARSHSTSWTHRISVEDGKWTRFLLDDAMLDALSQAESWGAVFRMRDVAKFSVSIVTGANGFFTVGQSTIDSYEMSAWAKPLMSRSFDSPGIVFRESDHQQAALAGRPAWLLHFDDQSPDPETHLGASGYLRGGEAAGLAKRYKCRIRTPWYRVPHVWPGQLMMTKRAHLHHRVILNAASVLTTDTVYRGTMTHSFLGREGDLVAGFHNSLTALTAEIEGRTYGGGVLELVPSEISRLLIPMLPTNGHLAALDSLSRQAGGQRDERELLLHETNNLLEGVLPEYGEVLDSLEAARQRLRHRRFDLERQVLSGD